MPTVSMPSATVKRFRDGTHRIRRPEETWERIRPLFPAVGITRVADVTGLDCIGIPVCNAIRPSARSLSVSQGKGIGLAQARVSAAMEAIELYHAERAAEEAIRATRRRLGTGRAVDPAALSVLPGASGDLSAREMRWIEGEDLLGGGPVWVPADAVSCDLTLGAASDGVLLTSSNGLGSGNHAAEAQLHGLCEAIERDQTCLHDAAGAHLGHEPALIDTATVDDPACRTLIGRIEAAGIRVFAWQQEGDIAVPSFGAAIADGAETPMPGGPIGTFQGYGCHPDRGIALSRAITEAVQARLTYISGARDDLYRDDYLLIQSRRNRRSWLAWLARERPSRSFRDVPDMAGGDVGEDLERVLAVVERAGFGQVAAVNLTLPGIGIPVVRMLVPGMVEPTAAGRVPGASPRVRRFLAQRAAAERLLRDGLVTESWA